MQLNEEQQRKLIAKLNQPGFWGNPPCLVCRSQTWNVSDILFELREFQGGNLVIGGPVFPAIAITCARCGNTILLNALVLGILTPEQAAASGQRLEEAVASAKK